MKTRAGHLYVRLERPVMAEVVHEEAHVAQDASEGHDERKNGDAARVFGSNST